MPAFKKFGPDDLLDNVLVLEPRYELASGSSGWHGGPAGSGSVALYGGARRSSAGVVGPITYQPFHQGTAQFGPVVRSEPQTSSVNFVWMINQPLSAPQRNTTNWGQEHFATVMRLYDYYGALDADYVTASYDYYCLYYQKDSNNVVWYQPPAAVNIFLTASFTVEAWVKPFLTSSAVQDFTIASMNQVFWFGITGSTGKLQISSSFGAFTASIGPAINRWSHVAFAYDATTQTGSFTVNMNDAGSIVQSTFSASLGSFLPAFTVGNQFSGSTSGLGDEFNIPFNNDYTRKGVPRRAFHGFIGETRLWYRRRSVTELSSSMGIPLTGSALTGSGLVICSKFDEGPLVTFPIDLNGLAPTRMGSGTVEECAMAAISASATNHRYPWGWILSFDDRTAPVWHPNDNVNFTPVKRLEHPPTSTSNLIVSRTMNQTFLTGTGYGQVNSMLVLDIPSAFYGRQISPTSLRLTCRAYSSASFGLVRTLVDDGRGNLYLSGSACSSTLGNREDYPGVQWNKVGNIFYGEGLVVIRDPALFDFGRTDGSSADPANTLQLSFRGTSRVPVKTLMCRLEPGEFNCTLNPTYWSADADLRRIPRHASASIRISTVGIYNSDREIVAIARFAEPVRKRPRDRINLKLRLDF